MTSARSARRSAFANHPKEGGDREEVNVHMSMYTEEQIAKYVLETINEAKNGIQKGHGGPFGALVVKNSEIIGRGHDTVIRDNDPSAHAEVNAIRDACKRLETPHLEGAILIVSSEPCPMCLAAAYWAKVDDITFCLSKEVAASVGFMDAFIYEDLALPVVERQIPLREFGGLKEEAAAVFKEWQNDNGILY